MKLYPLMFGLGLSQIIPFDQTADTYWTCGSSQSRTGAEISVRAALL